MRKFASILSLASLLGLVLMEGSLASGVSAVSQSEGSTVVGAVCAGYPPAGGSVCDSYCLFLGTGWTGSRGGETPPAGNTADWGLVNCGCGGATSGLLGTGCGS